MKKFQIFRFLATPPPYVVPFDDDDGINQQTQSSN